MIWTDALQTKNIPVAVGGKRIAWELAYRYGGREVIRKDPKRGSRGNSTFFSSEYKPRLIEIQGGATDTIKSFSVGHCKINDCWYVCNSG